MKHILLFLSLIIISASLWGQAQQVRIHSDDLGMKLTVNGEALMINGMNWDYFPIGTNYEYILWEESDEMIAEALENEMSLLQNMGVNAIRVYTGIPQRWVEHIYENYGIYTMLNHSFGRYGLTLEGQWVGNTEYSDPRVKEILLDEVRQLAEEYKDTPGLLLYLLGNENNYGLFWGGAETEDIPMVDRESTRRARYMYRLFNEAANLMKEIDPNHPVALCNGDLMFLDLIIEECPDVDIFGTNTYRGLSFGDAFERIQKEYGKPILFTEFGADAYHDILQEEDQKAQAKYLLSNWQEIYENAYGLGLTGNSLGGFTFQFSDGWWKSGQTQNLDVHNTTASWANAAYFHDFVEGKNNMNEEWFGICAKGPTNDRGIYELYPRAGYYLLKQVHQLNPFSGSMDLETISRHFDQISIEDAHSKALDAKKNKKNN